MNQNDRMQCEFAMTNLLESVITTHKMISCLPFDDHFKVVEELISIQEERCNEVIEEIKKVYEDEDYKTQRKMLINMVKILKEQIVGQKDDIDRPIPLRINRKAFFQMVGAMRG